MGVISKKCEVWKIYHSGYGPFLATDWLKTKGSGWVMGYAILLFRKVICLFITFILLFVKRDYL